MGGGGKTLGSLKSPVVFETPGGEGYAPEQEVTPTKEMPQPEVGVHPLVVILGAAALVFGGIYGLNRLLK